MNRQIWNFISVTWVMLPVVGLFLYLIGPISVELERALVGTFIGAVLAFASNWVLKYLSNKRDELSAGLHALYTLASQHEDFLMVRYGLIHAMAMMARERPDESEWCYVKPIGAYFIQDRKFDFRSLSFLLSDEHGKEAYGMLQQVERRYLDLRGWLEALNSSAIEIQKENSQLHQEVRNLTLADVEVKLGYELTGRARSQLQAVVLRIDSDEEIYLRTLDELSACLYRTFGSAARIKKIIAEERYSKSNLPPYPNKLREFLDSNHRSEVKI